VFLVHVKLRKMHFFDQNVQFKVLFVIAKSALILRNLEYANIEHDVCNWASCTDQKKSIILREWDKKKFFWPHCEPLSHNMFFLTTPCNCTGTGPCENTTKLDENWLKIWFAVMKNAENRKISFFRPEIQIFLALFWCVQVLFMGSFPDISGPKNRLRTVTKI